MKEVGRVSVRVMPDTSKTGADLMARLKKIERKARVILEVALDKTSMSKVEAQLQSLGKKVEIKIDLDSAALKSVQAKLAALSEKVDIKTDVDTAGASTRLAALTRPRSVPIRANIDMSSFARVGAVLASLTAGTGIVMALTTALGGLSAVVLGLIGPLSSFLASLGALGGIILPLPALIGAMATGIGLSMLAFKDAGKVLEDLGPKFQKFQKVVSTNFWSAAEKPIRSLVNNTLPLLQKESAKTSKILGQFFGTLSGALEQNLNKGNLGIMFDNMNKSIQALMPALNPLVSAFTTLGVVGSKYLPQLAGWISEISKRFDGWVQGAAASGELDRMIQDAVKGFQDLFSIVGNTFSIIGSIGGAAEAAGHATLGSLAENLERIDQALKSPVWQTGMTNFFTSLKAGSDTVIGALGSLLTQFATMGTFFDSFITHTTGAIASLLGGIEAAFADNMFQSNMVNLFADISALATGLAPAITPALQIVSGALAAIGSLMVAIAPALTALLTGLAPAFQVLVTAVTAFANVLGPVLTNVIMALMPILTTLISSVLPVILQVISALLPVIAPLIDLIAAIMVPALTLLTNLLTLMLPFIVQIATAVAGWLTALVPVIQLIMSQLIPVIMQLVQAVLPILMEAFNAIAPVISEIIAALLPLVTVILSTLIPVIQKLIPVVSVVFQTISNLISAAMKIISGIIKVVTGVIKGDWGQVWEGIKSIFSGVWDAIVAVVSGAINIVSSVISAALGIIDSLWNSAWDGIKNLLGPVWDAIVSGVSDGINGVIEWFQGLPGKALSALDGFEQKMNDMGYNVIAGFIGGIRDMAANVMGAVKDVVGGAIDSAKNLLGINSPSRVFKGIGSFTGEGLAIGIEGTSKAVARSMSTVYQGLVKTAETYDNKLGKIQSSMASVDLGVATNTMKRLDNVLSPDQSSSLIQAQTFDTLKLAEAKMLINSLIDQQRAKIANLRVEYDLLAKSIKSATSSEANFLDAVIRAFARVSSGVIGAADTLASVKPLAPISTNLDSRAYEPGGFAGGNTWQIMGPLLSVEELVVDSEDRVREISQELWRMANESDLAAGKTNLGGSVS